MKKILDHKFIYTPKKNVPMPMNVIVFASGGGGNLKAAIDLSTKEPELIKVGLVVTDRLGIPAIEIAHKYDIPTLAYNFEEECGVWKECKKNIVTAELYSKAAIQFHDRVLIKIISTEEKSQAPFDLVVLSYHRWIHGKLFDYFEERMINQHSGDLTIMKEDAPTTRKYIGINPILMALKAGETRTRTSTFLVREGHDNGEILCQGPWVQYDDERPITKESALHHENKQKQLSDWPSLTFALREIALGNFGLAIKRLHPDGSKILTYKGSDIPYHGVDLSDLA